MIQSEWIIGAILFLIIAVVVLSISLYFVRKEIKRINKFQFLIRDDVAEDVRKVKSAKGFIDEDRKLNYD